MTGASRSLIGLVSSAAELRRRTRRLDLQPGGLLVEGELVGTWRRSQGTVAVQTWRRLSRSARDAVEAEADSLPLPGVEEIVVRWDDRRCLVVSPRWDR